MEEKFQVTSSMEVERVEKEEFYEEIEAPTFVDFTIPNHFCPDDRFWFCSRVGCDQRHEEEMDPEAIYKNFVLRVMAARSPNVKFGRAISKKSPIESKKCPQSAPPKSSKSRIPRLALVSSSISKKLIDAENGKLKLRPPAATVKPPVSTPKARVKHVAAKYMTSPRKKKRSSPKLNGFRSVRNPKKTRVSLPKSKVVSKALLFSSPKKAPKRKASEELELETPVTKLCEGVKKLQINTQKKGIARKPLKECTSERKKLPSDGSRKIQSSKQRVKDADTARSGVKSTKAKANGRKHESQDGALIEVKKGGDECVENLDAVSLNIQKSELISASGSDSKVTADENTVPIEAEIVEETRQEKNSNTITDDLENQNPGVGDEVEDNDDKENSLNSDNIRNLCSNNLTKHDTPVKPKVVKTKQTPSRMDKISKENFPAGSGTPGLKNRKLKPTNPKPFRLRTDERGILKEATLERKVTSHENASTTTTENSQGNGNGVSENREKGSKKDDAKGCKKDQLIIKSRYKTSKEAEPKSEKSSGKTKSPFLQKQLAREIVPRVKSRVLLGLMQETETTKSKRKESKVPGKVEIDDPIKKAQITAAQGKRPVTIPREPKFHSLHRTKSGSRNKT